MNIVTENYAENLGAALGQPGDGFLAAVIAERLRADLADDAELPDQILVLVQSLDHPQAKNPSVA